MMNIKALIMSLIKKRKFKISGYFGFNDNTVNWTS